MSNTSSICLSCLQCCNGTLIGFVQLEKKDIHTLNELFDIETDSNGDGIFLQPCNNLCSDGCTIYEKRPGQCAKFNCTLLNSVEQNETSFDSAIEIINSVKQKKLAIENQISTMNIELKSPSFYFKMVELKKMFKTISSNTPLSPNQLSLASKIDKLGLILPAKFGISAF